VHTREDGTTMLTLAIPSEDLARDIERIVEQNPELTESRLTREALRRELQRYEQEEYNDD